jgi:hypothetical protein
VSDLLDFDPRFLRTCTFATLHTPGYGTRVTLLNAVEEGPFVTDFVVTMSAFDKGIHLGESGPILELAPGQIEKVDVDAVLASMVGKRSEPLRDVLGILHLTPRRLVGADRCEVSRGELATHVFATDDFVEFYSYRGDVVTGVAYQTGPMNDARLSTTRTTTIQAPKVIVSDRVDTILLLMNLSTSFHYSDDVTLRFRIVDGSARDVVSSSITVPAWSFRLLSTRDVLRRAGVFDDFVGRGGLGTLFGFAANGSVVPLSMTRNDETGAIAVDHTLPPVYYVSKWSGELRRQGNARLEQALFAEEREEAPAR